jgi:peptidoglycan/LPS O-acetylase OafA/YrhL
MTEPAPVGVEAETAARVAAPGWLDGGRIPGLDGLRALSIALVTASHLGGCVGSPLPRAYAARLDGGLGVDVFFVVSGFLITHLLLLERRKHGRVSLRGFYLRRAIRIFPAFYAWLAAVAILGACGLIDYAPRSWWAAATYVYSLLPRTDPRAVGQAWSLAVEEHFYLIWPALLGVLGPRRGAAALGAYCVAAIPLRLALWPYHPAPDAAFFTPTRLDTIAAGCLLGLLFHGPAAGPVVRRLRGRGDAAVAAGLGLLVFSHLILARSGKYQIGPMPTVDAAAIALVVAGVVGDPRGRLLRLLEARPLVAVGVLSYSLYLGQTFSNATNLSRWPLGWWWNLPLTVAYAVASHRLVERPFLRLRRRPAAR